MAPFKLKFRMGSSRSTSQEHDPDPQVNEALLNHHATAIGASSSTIDSADCTSVGSLSTNERKSLLPHKSNNLRLGYLNPNNAAQCTTTATAPQTPPPSYEHVLEENIRLVNTFDLCTPQRQMSSSSDERGNFSGQNLSCLGEAITQCTDPDCLENFANEQQLAAAQRQSSGNNNNHGHKSQKGNSTINNNNANNEHRQHRLQRQQEIEQDNDSHAQLSLGDESERRENIESDNNRKESIDSTELLISANMATPSSQENLLDNCSDECRNGAQYCACSSSRCSQNDSSNNDGSKDFCDPLINHNGYCANENHHYSNEGHCDLQRNQGTSHFAVRRGESDSEDGGWENSAMSSPYQRQQQKHTRHQPHHYQQKQQQYQQQQYQHHQQQQQQQQQQQYNSQQEQRSQTPEIISNKSSKEIYKDLAKQWGITCKMSDGCRCMECQSHYFDCEYDDNEHQKSDGSLADGGSGDGGMGDGGLGAGTPMFISEVMHGTACTIL